MRSAQRALSLIIALLLGLLCFAAAAAAGQVICLDAGHGGSDPGATNGDLEEKDINLDVAYRLKTLLEADGATVVLTRADDAYKSNSERYTAANSAQASVFVSVHTNSVLQNADTADGSMALYFKKTDPPLAQAIGDALYAGLSPRAQEAGITFRDWGLVKFASRILMSSDMPATIAEPVCMSHPLEAQWLASSVNLVDADGVVLLDALGNPTPNPECVDCRREEIAQALYQGIVTYLTPADAPPEVSLTSPSEGEMVSGPVEIMAQASDDHGVVQVAFALDGDPIGVDAYGADGWSLTWDSMTVSDGAHTLTATATDTLAQTASDSRGIIVANGSQPGSLHVGDLDGSASAKGRSGKWEAQVTIMVHDNTDTPVAGATVSGAWSGATSSSVSATTGTDGTAVVTSGNMDSGDIVTFTVDQVSVSGWGYDSSANHDPDGDSDGTRIDITRP